MGWERWEWWEVNDSPDWWGIIQRENWVSETECREQRRCKGTETLEADPGRPSAELLLPEMWWGKGGCFSSAFSHPSPVWPFLQPCKRQKSTLETKGHSGTCSETPLVLRPFLPLQAWFLLLFLFCVFKGKSPHYMSAFVFLLAPDFVGNSDLFS